MLLNIARQLAYMGHGACKRQGAPLGPRVYVAGMRGRAHHVVRIGLTEIAADFEEVYASKARITRSSLRSSATRRWAGIST